MKKWKCTVCGYIHIGETPPEQCPVCGADQSKFTEVTEEETAQAAPAPETETEKMADTAPKGSLFQVYEMAAGLIVKHHLHPISVHIPNGVVPISVFFVVLAVLFQMTHFGLPAFYNLIFVALAMPAVLFSGYVEWQKRYRGYKNPTLLIKMLCGTVVLLTSIGLVLWQAISPDVLNTSSRWPFLILHLIMLAAAGVAGHLGGKLVFEKRDKLSK